ncbi:glycosyltransferase family 2 protein [Thermasporomyces composti]|uniref:GT2 family glycosyltransferase n=1 Tax=Thermasporomyces composti TaxID=696763 RepID=A0A3D9V6W0_THECX|nr:glycosyltransferase family 2 protein [Thermasporomyces composti]REF37518.1 GT2 family glycosyltransferase [Thermasporomyces composti]
MSAHPGPQALAPSVVTAVVVAHDGAPWIGELISGLRAQRRAPNRLIVVDTGSRDESRALLAGGLPGAHILDAPAVTGFGAAVARAVQTLPPGQPGEWLWLLHDDCAPDPEALASLLRLAEAGPDVAVVGPKLRDWPRGRRLLEFGVTIAGSGNRETGLEFGEFDQGQHDAVRDVLAVSTAGMLVRRDVFERLGGFDQRFGLFRDDVDFGWRVVRAGYRVLTCPEAVVFHAEAGLRGYRELHAVNGRPRRIDRRNALFTLLVNSPAWKVPFLLVRAVLGSLLRVLALLVAKWPDAAYDEFRALLGVLARPDRIVVGRLRRARYRRVPHRVVRRLLPPPWIGIQHTVDALAAVLSTRSGEHAGPSRRARRPVETGPVSEEVEELTTEGLGIWRWLATRPPIVALLALTLLTLVASRHLLGGGSLAGGALLPAPDSVLDLWRRYVEGWHPVDLGSDRPAPPYLAVVAALGTLLVGKAWLAVDLLVLGAVPLSGLTSYLLMRTLARSRALRIWATVTYALLPAVLGAVASGRLGTCVALIVLPLLVLAAARMVGAGRPGPGSWSAAWTSGLLLAVLTAFVPIGYVGALVVAAASRVVPPLRRPGTGARVAVALIVPPVLLLPWLPVVVANPSLLLGEVGLATPAVVEPSHLLARLLVASPGDPTAAPAWIFGPLVVVAVAALLRREPGRGVLVGWTVSLTGLALGLAQTRLTVATDWMSTPTSAWPGFACAVVCAGWIIAIVCGADGAVRDFSERSLSWRQPAAVLLACIAVLSPLVATGWWVIRGAGEPLARDAGSAVPAYIRDAQRSGARPRALVIEGESGRVRYTVLRGAGTRLGDAETGAAAATLASLDATVGDLLSDVPDESTAARLATYGIGYVYLPSPADPRSVERIDTTPGLTRTSAPEGSAAWRVDLPVGQLRVLPPGSSDETAVESAEVLEVDAGGAAVTVPSGPPGRLLLLAETHSDRWRATIDGQPLPSRTFAGWAQAFELPTTGGRLVLSYAPGMHGKLLGVQAVLFVVILVLALPTRPRRDGDGPGAAQRPAGGRHGAAAPRPPGRRAAGAGAPASGASRQPVRGPRDGAPREGARS